MPSQSTERNKSWHSQSRLVCDRCCALVNSSLNRAIVTTSPGLPYFIVNDFVVATLLLLLLLLFPGDLAEVVLRQGPVTEEGKLNIGADGHWNSSYISRWYFLNTNEDLFYTAAEIRGDLDGLILATEIAGWYSRYPNIKLSQILDMYYSDRGVFNTTIRACNRKALLTSVAPNSTTVEQVCFVSL